MPLANSPRRASGRRGAMSAALLAVALLASGTSRGAVPSEGVVQEVRRGFFTETDIGGFLTVGGRNAYSNLQSYLQLGVGYQLTVADGAGLVPLGVHLGIGANGQNCWAGLLPDGTCSASDSFTLTFVSLSAGYLFRVAEQLYLGPRLLVGGVLLDPEPVSGVRLAASVGGSLSLEYATSMDHFSVGLDVSYRLVLGPRISAIAIHPRVQYTF